MVLNRDFQIIKNNIDTIGTMSPMAAVNWIVNPHKSKAIVKRQTLSIPQNPHFRLISKPTAAIIPTIPRNINITRRKIENASEMGLSRNWFMPSVIPRTPNINLAADWRIQRIPIKILAFAIPLFCNLHTSFSRIFWQATSANSISTFLR